MISRKLFNSFRLRSSPSLRLIYTKGTNLDKKKYKQSQLVYQLENLAL